MSVAKDILKHVLVWPAVPVGVPQSLCRAEEVLASPEFVLVPCFQGRQPGQGAGEKEGQGANFVGNRTFC